ncbi:unnamed protein product [Ectocarpus sp. 8 AP-2014]
MKVWPLEQPLFLAHDFNGTLAIAQLLYASLFCNGDVDVDTDGPDLEGIQLSLRGNRRLDLGYRLGAATLILVSKYTRHVPVGGLVQRHLRRPPADQCKETPVFCARGVLFGV